MILVGYVRKNAIFLTFAGFALWRRPVASGRAKGRRLAQSSRVVRILRGENPPPENHFKARWQTIAPEHFGGRIYPGEAWQGGGWAAAGVADLGVCFLG